MTSIERDLADRVCRVRTMDEYGTGSEFTLCYDEHGHAKNVQERIGSLNGSMRTYTTTYTYDKDDRVTQTGFGDEKRKAARTYDALGRVSTRKVYADYTYPALDAKYTYLEGAPISGVDAKSTTPLVSAITQDGVSYEYEYDSVTSNLITERRIQGKEPTIHDKYARYEYDKLGQLVRVNDMNDTTSGADGTTWVYEYDFGGNILRKKRYTYQTGELTGEPAAVVNYEYADTNWKDKVTSIGGKALSYDAIGNIVNDSEWTYSWQAGRQLKSMSKPGTEITYGYDQNGMRISKRVNGEETSYTLSGAMITHMRVGTKELHFFYDGRQPTIMEYDGMKYVYVSNIQGDVVGMLDAVGNVVVEYSYDAWGKPLAVTGGMADTVGKLNPFRYRGYVWDEETGLYYLRSRYYRPEWGRFVSADNVLGKEGAILSHNSFTYCANQPIMLDDASGNSPRFSKTAVEGMPGLKAMSGSNIAASVINSYAGEDYVVDPGGKFSISMGEERMPTADKEMRDAVINAISAAVGGLRSYVFGNIGGKVLKHLGKYPRFAERLKNVAGWLGTIAEFVDYDPLERMYSWRDGNYTYTRYTWTYECTFLWFSFTNFSITYEIRDYGGGYEEVWMSNQNYIFPSASISEMKILEGSYD